VSWFKRYPTSWIDADAPDRLTRALECIRSGITDPAPAVPGASVPVAAAAPADGGSAD